tara:strand:+ start:3620 stop:3862 length:243 start_codon:yes stop_codon:yes gene_type:complete
MTKKNSEYSGPFFEDCLCVDVQIYGDLKEGWRLSTDDGENAPVLWSEKFQKDIDAWNRFLEIVENEGMEAISGPIAVKHR